MTVTGIAPPSSAYSCVMPTFLPMRPWTGMVLLGVLLAERLDLDVDARRQVELHHRVDGLRRGLEDVEQAPVRADLELLAALLVDVGRAVDGPAVLDGRQRDRPGHARAR